MPRVPSSSKGAGVGGGGVGAGGVAFEAQMPLLGLGKPEGEVGVGEREGELFVALLEVDAGAGGFDVGEAGGGAGGPLAGGCGGHAGGLKKDGFEVPAAVGQVDEVDAGGVEGDLRELDAAPPEGAPAESEADGVGAEDGLGAEGGVFADDEIGEGEARHGQHGDGDRIDADGAAEAERDAVRDLAAEVVDVDERRQRDQEDDREQHSGHREHAAAGRQTDGPGLEVVEADLFGGVVGRGGRRRGRAGGVFGRRPTLVDSLHPLPLARCGRYLVGRYLIRWKVRFQRVLSGMWMAVVKKEPTRAPKLVFWSSIFSAVVSKDQ